MEPVFLWSLLHFSAFFPPSQLHPCITSIIRNYHIFSAVWTRRKKRWYFFSLLLGYQIKIFPKMLSKFPLTSSWQENEIAVIGFQSFAGLEGEKSHTLWPYCFSLSGQNQGSFSKENVFQPIGKTTNNVCHKHNQPVRPMQAMRVSFRRARGWIVSLSSHSVAVSSW